MTTRFRIATKRDISITLIAIGLAMAPLALGWEGMAVVVSIPLGLGILLWVFTPHTPHDRESYIFLIPLTIIILFAFITLAANTSLLNMGYFAYMCAGLLLFLVVRDYGWRVTKFIALAAGIVAITTIGVGLAFPGERLGGITPNANLAAGFMLIGIFFCRGRWKWLIPIIIIGIFFTGYKAAVAFLPAIGVLMLWPHRTTLKHALITHKPLVVAVATTLIILAVVGTTTGIVFELFGSPITNTRLDQAAYAIEKMGLIGNGYDFGIPSGWIHNVPLLVAVEFGTIASIAWIAVMGYAMLKRRNIYRFPVMALFLLSMVGVCWKFCDLTPFFWALLGLSASKTSEAVA